VTILEAVPLEAVNPEPARILPPAPENATTRLPSGPTVTSDNQSPVPTACGRSEGSLLFSWVRHGGVPHVPPLRRGIARVHFSGADTHCHPERLLREGSQLNPSPRLRVALFNPIRFASFRSAGGAPQVSPARKGWVSSEDDPQHRRACPELRGRGTPLANATSNFNVFAASQYNKR